jgi:hypothetical protein
LPCWSSAAVVDELTPGAVLVELARALAQCRCAPEAGPHGLVLVEDLLLLEPLGNQDVERSDRHDHEDGKDRPGDYAALIHGFPEAELVLRHCAASGGEEFDVHG